jgi:Na+-transporting methylmalonyl-CoA/oxaloacetate decarboxylase gamma subunit
MSGLFDFAGYTDLGRGFFLMAAGIGFVFIVQVIFYLIIKLWPKTKE